MVEMLLKRGVDICCLQEVWYRGEGTISVGANNDKFKLWHSGGEGGENGVGTFIKSEQLRGYKG